MENLQVSIKVFDLLEFEATCYNICLHFLHEDKAALDKRIQIYHALYDLADVALRDQPVHFSSVVKIIIFLNELDQATLSAISDLHAAKKSIHAICKSLGIESHVENQAVEVVNAMAVVFLYLKGDLVAAVKELDQNATSGNFKEQMMKIISISQKQVLIAPLPSVYEIPRLGEALKPFFGEIIRSAIPKAYALTNAWANVPNARQCRTEEADSSSQDARSDDIVATDGHPAPAPTRTEERVDKAIPDKMPPVEVKNNVGASLAATTKDRRSPIKRTQAAAKGINLGQGKGESLQWSDEEEGATKELVNSKVAGVSPKKLRSRAAKKTIPKQGNENDLSESEDSLQWSDTEDSKTKGAYGKRKVPFTASETDFLRAGVLRYGVGQWATILCNYEFKKCRTSVSLKDKYRTMKRRGEI